MGVQLVPYRSPQLPSLPRKDSRWALVVATVHRMFTTPRQWLERKAFYRKLCGGHWELQKKTCEYDICTGPCQAYDTCWKRVPRCTIGSWVTFEKGLFSYWKCECYKPYMDTHVDALCSVCCSKPHLYVTSTQERVWSIGDYSYEALPPGPSEPTDW